MIHFEYLNLLCYLLKYMYIEGMQLTYKQLFWLENLFVMWAENNEMALLYLF